MPGWPPASFSVPLATLSLADANAAYLAALQRLKLQPSGHTPPTRKYGTHPRSLTRSSSP